MKRFRALIVLLALLSPPAFAESKPGGETAIPIPPAPRDTRTSADLMRDDWTRAQNATKLEDRLRGFRSARGLSEREGLIPAGEQRAPTKEEWQSRFDAFLNKEAAAIAVGYPDGLPAPPRPCDRQKPDCQWQNAIDMEMSARFEVLAEIAKREGDGARFVAMRFGEVIFGRGVDPHPSIWVSLSNEALNYDQFERAGLYCNYLDTTGTRAFYGDRFEQVIKRCRSNVLFAQGDFKTWMTLNAARYVDVKPLDTRDMLIYCVASTRGGWDDFARIACPRAREAVQTRTRYIDEHADRQRDHYTEQARKKGLTRREIGLAEAALALWREDLPGIESAIRACTRSIGKATSPDCATPKQMRMIGTTFVSFPPRI